MHLLTMIAPMFTNAPDFDAWFPEPDGFPRPDWKAIREFIRSHSTEEHWSAAWQEIVRAWLERTCRTLGSSYALSESDNFHLLSELERKDADQLSVCSSSAHGPASLTRSPTSNCQSATASTRFCDSPRKMIITATLPASTWTRGLGLTAGKFIRRTGYMHIAYTHDDRQGADRQTLAYLLTNNLLYSFPLPYWLGAALAMLFTRDIAGGATFIITRETAEEHRAYWNPTTIQHFWSGWSFHSADSGELSFTLARILLDFIVTDVHPAPAEFRDFVLHADRKDAGQAPARDYLGVGAQAILLRVFSDRASGDRRPLVINPESD